MKKSLYVLAFTFLLSGNTYAQELDRKRTVEYCDVLIIEKSIGNKVYASVDFGQERKKENERLKDDAGVPMLFNSPMDVLNFMNRQGWELVEMYQNKELKYDNRHFVMKRQVSI